MKPALLACWLLASAAGAWGAAENALPPGATPILNPEKEGAELATRLRSTAPEENSEFTGILEITSRDGKVWNVPVASTVTVTPTNWQVLYRTAPTNGSPAETLTITHTPGRPSRFELKNGSNNSTPVALNRAFGGSDFWLLDLGLDFLHWPTQRALRAEMVRSRPCRVLESIHPQPAAGSYARVVSWVDLEAGGILQADAFDPQGKLLKKFAIGPVKKIEGQWKLREMRIRNMQSRQQTELKFDLKARPPVPPGN